MHLGQARGVYLYLLFHSMLTAMPIVAHKHTAPCVQATLPARTPLTPHPTAPLRPLARSTRPTSSRPAHLSAPQSCSAGLPDVAQGELRFLPVRSGNRGSLPVCRRGRCSPSRCHLQIAPSLQTYTSENPIPPQTDPAQIAQHSARAYLGIRELHLRHQRKFRPQLPAVRGASFRPADTRANLEWAHRSDFSYRPLHLRQPAAGTSRGRWSQ